MTDETGRTVEETRAAVYEAMRGIRGQVAESARRRRGGDARVSGIAASNVVILVEQ